MSFGFGDKENIPGVSPKEKMIVPKPRKKPHARSHEEVLGTAKELQVQGLVNDRSSALKKKSDRKKRKSGRPKTILQRDTMTLTGERAILDRFREFAEERPNKTLVQCLDELLNNQKTA